MRRFRDACLNLGSETGPDGEAGVGGAGKCVWCRDLCVVQRRACVCGARRVCVEQKLVCAVQKRVCGAKVCVCVYGAEMSVCGAEVCVCLWCRGVCVWCRGHLQRSTSGPTCSTTGGRGASARWPYPGDPGGQRDQSV